MIQVSRDVILDVQFLPCSGGPAGFVVRGSHAHIDGYLAEYDGCTGTYRGF